ncbi:hypothetical protein [Methylobacterium sp. Leaf118]|uniref:hypothetical protein n=1 Tax=Methylobacterium sp. Leaf118 TaxID=2876562 RepID=UPI001E47C9A0|nr:hypothetical protein [Methylobacterium sp. Leaf118]
MSAWANHITALVGPPGTLAGLGNRFGSPDPVAVAFGLIVLGLDEDRLDALALSSAAAFDGFTVLTPALSAALGRSLNEGPALDIETRYFGGRGGQGAALFEGGAMVWRATETARGPAPSPISQGLARWGVSASDGGDAFDSLGLGRVRSPAHLGVVFDP